MAVFFGYNPCHLRDPCVDHDFIAGEGELNGWRMPGGDDSLIDGSTTINSQSIVA